MRWMENAIAKKDPKFNITLHFLDSECAREGIIKISEFIAIRRAKNNSDPMAFIGPVCPYAAQWAAYFGGYWNMPVITPGANYGFDEKERDFIFDGNF
jgi:hypothetical protein